MTIAERPSKTDFIFINATGFDRKQNEYIHSLPHTGCTCTYTTNERSLSCWHKTKSTSSTNDLKCVMSHL